MRTVDPATVECKAKPMWYETFSGGGSGRDSAVSAESRPCFSCNNSPKCHVRRERGGSREIGVYKWNSAYSGGVEGRLAEILIYTGTSAILTGGNVTTNETYLNCRYGL